MTTSEQFYYRKDLAWRNLPGYETQRLRANGGIPADEIEAAGFKVLEGDKPTRLNLAILRFSAFVVGSVDSDSGTFVWRKAYASTRRRFLVIFVNRGMLSIGTSTADLAPVEGNVVILYPNAKPVYLKHTGRVESVVFAFDERELLPYVARQGSQFVFPGVSAVHAPAFAFLSSLSGTKKDSHPLGSNAIREVLRVLARAILVEADVARSEECSVKVNDVRALVELRFAAPDFTVQSLAAELGITRRALERVLAPTQLTPSRLLRERRAARAKHLLEANGRVSLGNVAASSGFASTEALKRALVLFYGMSAREIVAESLTKRHEIPSLDKSP
ncbi:hypothetical protein C5E10_13670 [Pseudoclavibacter sp. RFBG4]|nr:hypothetical protein C5E10_13670 [Pseudoclavibacter sp. RFBG4]